MARPEEVVAHPHYCVDGVVEQAVTCGQLVGFELPGGVGKLDDHLALVVIIQVLYIAHRSALTVGLVDLKQLGG